MTPELLLPESIPAVPGIECNIYFDGLFADPSHHAGSLRIVSGIGSHFSNRWSFLPAQEHLGEHPVTFRFCPPGSDGGAEHTVWVRVVPGYAADTTYLPVGDSLTYRGVYSAHIRKVFEQRNGCLRLVGSCAVEGQPGNRHEGYPGWKFTDCLSRAEEDPASPFLFSAPDGAAELDFERYVTETLAGVAPGFVTLFFGANDIALSTDATIAGDITKALEAAKRLADMILVASPDSQLGLILPPPPAASQDAFGLNYGCQIPRWQYVRNQRRLVHRLYETFARYHRQVAMIPAHLALDVFEGYPVSELPVHARTTRTRPTASDSVHPAESGFRQIGDAVFAWMMSVSDPANPTAAPG